MDRSADALDYAADLAERERAEAIASRQPFVLELGRPGECEFCGQWRPRLVDGACVPCRNEAEKRRGY
jgi:hypothetical protein